GRGPVRAAGLDTGLPAHLIALEQQRTAAGGVDQQRVILATGLHAAHPLQIDPYLLPTLGMSHVEGRDRLRTNNRIGLQALLALELPDCLLQYLIVAQWLRLIRVISQQRSVQWTGCGLGVEQ